MLSSTEVAGQPDSFFMRDPDPVWVKAWGLPDPGKLSGRDYSAAYLAAAIRVGSGQTGIFGLRLMKRSLEDLTAMIGEVYADLPSDRARLQAAFGDTLYIHLARGDKVAQAVSAVKAEQTGLWHIASDGTELERLGPPKSPSYDFEKIAAKLAELEEQDVSWRAWFDAQGIAPVQIGYEALSAVPAATVNEILAALGVRAPVPGTLTPGVAKLADDVSARWVCQFRAGAGLIR